MQQGELSGLIQIVEMLNTEGQRDFFNYIRRMLGELLPISDHLKAIRETRFAENFTCPHCGDEKVKRNLATRKPRKRGGKASKRGISNEPVAIMVALSRDGGIVCRTSGQVGTTPPKIHASVGHSPG